MSTATALTVPTAHGWDFGDYPYGLEPLTLPAPGNSWLTDGTGAGRLRESWLDLASATQRRGALLTTPAAEEDLERLFWFRWITGHHISFVIWRLLAGLLEKLETGRCDPQETTAAVTEYVRAYSAMLLYTGSATRQVYNDTIRPSMYRLHNTFSGTWSADFQAVRSLFRGRRLPAGVAAGGDVLREEVRLGHQIHLGVASKLVVGGRSLLQQLVDSPAAQQPRVWSSVFDCYFLTLRAPVTEDEVLAQLLRRCKAVATDLVTNGLYPEVADYPESRPEELSTNAVLACEKEITDIVLRLGGLATDRGRGAGRGAPERKETT